MKILMFVPLFYPHIGGVEKHSLEISKILSEQGHNIIIMTYKFDEKLRDFERFNKILIIRIPTKNYVRIWIHFVKYRNLFRKCDIIHFHDFNTFYWFLPFIILNSNIYITFHGYERHPIPKVYIFLRKIAEIFTKGNICVGKFILKYYKTKPTFIIYGGVNLNKSNNIDNRKTKNLNSALFIGRLDSDTGILEYIKALKFLKYEYNIDFHLEICGDGQLRKQIEDYCKIFDLSITINGFVENLDKFYDKCRIVLCSSYLCILESLYQKKFVISFYQNELKKDYLEKSPFAKYISITKHPVEIAQCTRNFLKSNKIFSKKIKDGYKFSLRNEWSKIIKFYIKLWKDSS